MLVLPSPYLPSAYVFALLDSRRWYDQSFVPVFPINVILKRLPGPTASDCVDPGSIFKKVGMDYAGPVNIKYGHVWKPVIMKAYICIFVSLSVHLELVSDLTSEALQVCPKLSVIQRFHCSKFWLNVFAKISVDSKMDIIFCLILCIHFCCVSSSLIES